MAFLLGGLLLLAWASLLLAFKLLCLDKIKCHLGRYSLGMIFAYGLLLLLYVASEHYPPLKALLLNWYIGRIPGGIILILVPAIYSIFLIGKGYFQEGSEKASFKWKLKMMASVLLQCVFGSIRSGVFFFPPERGHFFRVGDTCPSVSTVYPLGMAACFRGLLGADRPDCVARP